MVWKILFIIYSLVIMGLGFLGVGVENDGNVKLSEALINTSVEVMLVLAMVYTFALGWKKQLVSERFNKYFFNFSVVAFVFVGVFLYKQTYAPMYSDMLLSAMKNGMVPRHWDFQMLLAMTRVEVLIFVLLALFITFVPFYLAYYHYKKCMTELGVATNSGRKCFAVYVISSYAFVFLSLFFGLSGEIVNFNIFDCLSTLSSIYISLGVAAYAFNIEILNPVFWRVSLPVCICVLVIVFRAFRRDCKL